MQNFFKDFDWSAKSIAKVIGVIFLGIIVLSIVVGLLSFAVRTIFNGGSYNTSYSEPPYMMSEKSSTGGRMMTQDAVYSPEIAPSPQAPTGDDAENYEVKTYNATIKTRKLERVCEQIADLKSRPEVIFETANENENNCYYSFKVKKENEAEIIVLLKTMKPEDMNANTQTIKGMVEQYDKQLEILENKLASIEDSLTKSQKAYDEVTRLATNKQDVESLAKIIDSKLNLIERLSTQRIQVKEEMDRYKQSKNDQLDRLNYSFFNVNIYKDLILDWKNIKNTWTYELKAMVRNINASIQGVTVNMVTYLVRLAQVAVYFFISMFLLKFAWVATKKIWTWRKK